MNMLSRVLDTRSAAPTQNRARKRYLSTIDQAREYAADLGPDMAYAFDELSHRTALVLRAYVTAVYQEGHSYRETESIRDAMKQHFEDSFGCQDADWVFVPDHDEYTIDGAEDRGRWVGNPVFDATFVSLMQELKTREDILFGAPQAQRQTAIGYEDMEKLMLHLQKPTTIEAEGLGRCLFSQALASTAFMLWLTFDEVLRLKRGHVRFHLSDYEGPSWLTVTVPFRNSDPMDPAQANVYEIHPQIDEPHACCFTKLLAWVRWIEMHKHCELTADDFLFPGISKGDHILLKKPLSVTQLSAFLDKHARDSGLMERRYIRLDTHCFRRGGAQHRLIHAQDTWSLQSVRWWGGWFDTEPVEKIMEYLLDEPWHEADFGDMMAPHARRSRGYTGTARHTLEVLAMKEQCDSVIQSMESKHRAAFSMIEKENQELRQQIADLESIFSSQLERAVHALTSQTDIDHLQKQAHQQPCSLDHPELDQSLLDAPDLDKQLGASPIQPHLEHTQAQPREQRPNRDQPQPRAIHEQPHSRQLLPELSQEQTIVRQSQEHTQDKRDSQSDLPLDDDMEIDQRSEPEVGLNEDQMREDGESIEVPYKLRSSIKHH